MKAVIKLDVPEWQIGQDVSVYFPDTMWIDAKCEAAEEQEAKPVKVIKNSYDHEFYYCPKCDRPFYEQWVKPKFCDKCGQEVKWE